VPKVNKELQAEIEKAFSPEYLARKEELILAGEWVKDLSTVLFSIGNTHENVANPKRAHSNKDELNSHRWTMYVSMANGKAEESSKYIKSVTYHLCYGFNPRVIKVTQAPFLLARVGWGYFDVELVVEYHPEYKLKN
jgi:transcription initiation factor IIF auxiliary subunit